MGWKVHTLERGIMTRLKERRISNLSSFEDPWVKQAARFCGNARADKGNRRNTLNYISGSQARSISLLEA